MNESDKAHTPAGADTTGHDRKRAVIERYADFVSPRKVDFFQSVGIDFIIGRRQGPYVWDIDGKKRLINCHCNGGVFNLGHRHPEIAGIVREKLSELDIGNHHFISEARGRLAAKLAELTPGDLQHTVFGVSGGEAVDLALKVARGYTARQKIISASGGYHGHTGLALAAGDARYRDPFGPNLPGFMQIPFNDPDALARAVDANTAAVIFETVPATLGMPVADKEFYSTALEICRKNGALLIVDEIQTGLGRTGTLWACEQYDIVPDILVTGKGLSGGIYPISATCLRPRLQSVFEADPFIHVSTFGGAEIGCEAAIAVLELSSRQDFLRHVKDLSDFFKSAFAPLQKKHPEILTGLRQLGLMMGIEMVNEMCGPVLSRTMFDNGVLSIYANNDTRISQFLPPLIIDMALAAEIMQRVDRALGDAKRMLEL